MKKLIKELEILSNKGIIGIKQSFEDEGALHQDILTMRRITELCNLKLSVKIGGCEAKTDINFCNNIGVNGIVAPMVETKFAFQKFIESVIDLKNIKFYINIESKTAYKNLSNILESPSSKLISGIVIGRSDLVKSYGYSKDQVNADFINDIVNDILMQCKSYGLETLMGGNISPASSSFIKKMYDDKLLQYIETRNIIIKLNDSNIKNISNTIKSSLLFESDWLKYKANHYLNIGNNYINRSEIIKDRIS
tara:strand:+ start:29 stop:781 length:753 start_codon:yes stop_codon:yes gene_type:complete